MQKFFSALIVAFVFCVSVYLFISGNSEYLHNYSYPNQASLN